VGKGNLMPAKEGHVITPEQLGVDGAKGDVRFNVQLLELFGQFKDMGGLTA
jgi:hypothetical protein